MESFLIARVGNTKIAINIKNIHFVIRNNGIVKVPDMPDGIDGIISFRDKVIPILNNKKKLNFENDSTDRKRIVLCEVEKNILFGLNVDEYLEIVKVEKRNTKRLTLKVKNEVIPVIELSKIISEEEIELAKRI